MSLLGKILLFVNLLAGVGFAYLAIHDYYGDKGKNNGRQNITAAGLRHIMLLNGLPLEGTDQIPTDPEAEIPLRVEMAGGVNTDTVSPALLKAYFATVGAPVAPADGSVVLPTNTPVTNQLAEVKRVRDLIKGDLDKKDGRARANAASGWLLLQAESFEERSQIQALLAADAGDELANRLYAKFDQVINAPKIPDISGSIIDEKDDAKVVDDKMKKLAEARAAGVKDEPERRVRLAHLLVHLDQDPVWQKRVVLVIGIRRYARAVSDQTSRFREMALRVERLTLDDQDRFAAQIAQLRGLAIERTQMVREMAEARGRLEEQKRKDEEFVAQRKTQLQQLTADLQRVKAEVDALIARQTEVELQLFAVQREVALTLEDIYKLQEELIAKERERYSPSKK